MSNDNEFGERSTEPVRVFIDSKNSYQPIPGHHQFFLNLDSYYDTFEIHFQVRKIQCTYSWYNINSSNNKLSFNNADQVITISPGNYNLYSLLEILNDNGFGYGFTYNVNTGIITVNRSIAFTWDVTSSLAPILGWTTFPTGTAATIWTAPGLPDVSPVKVVNFHMQTVPARSFALYPASQQSRLIGSLFVGNTSPYNVIESDDVTFFRETTLQSSVRYMEIATYDQRGLPIDLQNGSFQMLLEFSFRPKKVVRLTEYL
jgi:hypothetical protein